MKLTSTGDEKALIETNMLECDLPLFFSKEAIKKGKMSINFSRYSVNVFGMEKLWFTTSGHYCIQTGKYIQSRNFWDHEILKKRKVFTQWLDWKSSKEKEKTC